MTTITLAFACALAVSAGEAQDLKKEVNDPEVSSGLQQEGVRRARFNEVERGFSFRLPVGVMWYLTPVNTSGLSKKYDPGLLVGIELGYDIARFIDIGGFVYFSQSPGQPAQPNRDLTTVLGGLMARVTFISTERFYFGVRAGAGYGMQNNLIEAKTTGVGAIAAASAEYYTHLRHFSLALDVGTMIWTTPVAVALTVLPAVRYTF